MDKRRFKIINTPPEYSLKTQINLIFALTGLHNFIKDHPSQRYFNYFEAENNDSIISYHLTSMINLPLGNSLVISTRKKKYDCRCYMGRLYFISYTKRSCNIETSILIINY